MDSSKEFTQEKWFKKVIEGKNVNACNRKGIINLLNYKLKKLV